MAALLITTGCPPSAAAAPAPSPVGAGTALGAGNGLDGANTTSGAAPSPPPPGPSNASSSSNTSAQQQAAAHAYSCSLLLRGCSNQTLPRSAGATAAPGAPPCFAAAELHCTSAVAPSSSQGAATAGAPDAPRLQVEVGQQLLPHLTYSGVDIIPRADAAPVVADAAGATANSTNTTSAVGNSSVSIGAQDVWDWGISILGQAAESVKLQHSWISDLPLSPAGPLVECR